MTFLVLGLSRIATVAIQEQKRLAKKQSMTAK
jgi:hypothetical protein